MTKKKLKNCPECGMKVVSLYSDRCFYCNYEFWSRCEKCNQLISVFKNKHTKCVLVKSTPTLPPFFSIKDSIKRLIERSEYYGKKVCSYCNETIESEEEFCPYCHHNQIEVVEVAEKRNRAISKSVQREVWRRDMGRCVECGTKERLEYDHIIPFSKGGSNTARNIQLLCEKCNREKYNRIGG